MGMSTVSEFSQVISRGFDRIPGHLDNFCSTGWRLPRICMVVREALYMTEREFVVLNKVYSWIGNAGRKPLVLLPGGTVRVFKIGRE
jgi:hypothetical protein